MTDETAKERSKETIRNDLLAAYGNVPLEQILRIRKLAELRLELKKHSDSDSTDWQFAENCRD